MYLSDNNSMDKTNEFSAEATGTARYSTKEMEKPKAFENSETISVGRALSFLGYMADGEINTENGGI